MCVRWLYVFNTLPHFSRLETRCPVHCVCSRFRGLHFSTTALAVYTYSHVLQFLYAEWQQSLSVPFFYLSLSSSPILDPSPDQDILQMVIQTNLLAYGIEDT